MKIGELAKRTGVSVTTLRYYEKRELILAGSRTPGGYREYDGADLKKVETLVASKQLGFTLQEIVQILDAAEDPSKHETIVALVEARLVEVRKEIDELKQLEKKLASRLDEWNSSEQSDKDPLSLILGKAETKAT